MNELSTKVDSMRRTLAAVLARELNPHLKPANASVPTPTIVPVTTPTAVCMSPVPSVSTAQSMQIIPTSQPLINATTSSGSRIAHSLMSPIATASVLYNTASAQLNLDLPVSAQPPTSHPSEVISENGIPVGRDIMIDTSEPQFMSLPDLTKIFNKSCSQCNYAANLVRVLFDEETRKLCNVSGRGKEMLNPVIVGFIKNMCFQFFPLNGTEKQVEEWGKCVVSIDESSRRLRNKPRKEKPRKEQ